tara:strand:+ start:28 stop:600 length:573 start_codon:yes stop_codon:yes gene_type:complete
MSLPVVLQRCQALGYKVFEGEWDLNIVAIRSADQTPNVFNDLITVSTLVDSQWTTWSFQCTTDPGLYHLRNPSRVEGTAALCPGQYRSSHKLGLHRGRYTALTQCGPVKVFRDPTLDDTLDLNEDSIMEGVFGINVHKAGSNSTLVNKWSAGCVVLSNEERYDFFIELCKKQAEVHPTWTKYSLTLLEEW